MERKIFTPNQISIAIGSNNEADSYIVFGKVGPKIGDNSEITGSEILERVYIEVGKDMTIALYRLTEQMLQAMKVNVEDIPTLDELQGEES